MTIQEFMAAARITARVVKVRDPLPFTHARRADVRAAKDNWKDSAREYRVMFERAGRRELVTPFWSGVGNTKPPTGAEVLDCLASDASGFRDATTFEEWADEYGYDIDSREAEQMWRAVAEQTRRLRNFLTPADYETLVTEVERL